MHVAGRSTELAGHRINSISIIIALHSHAESAIGQLPGTEQHTGVIATCSTMVVDGGGGTGAPGKL